MARPFKMGDLVLLSDGRTSFIVRLDGPSVKLGGGKGSITTGPLIGKAPGDRVPIGSRELTLLRPDVMDHLGTIQRGPQMILPKDSSRIAMYLGIRSRDTLIEAGAGSGGLTLALLNSVWPDGKVITYDIRKDHLAFARSNVERTDMASCWEGRIADVREGVPDRDADAIAIDIPDPENAVSALSRSLRPGGRMCSFVPTTNQVERCVKTLREGPYTEIEAIELIERKLSVKEGAVRPDTDMLGHTGYIIMARMSP